MNLLAAILEGASYFNWPGALVAWGRDISSGPSHTFLIQGTGNRSPRGVARELKAQGISSRDLMIVNDTLMLTVPLADAPRASVILKKLECEVDNPVVSVENVGTPGTRTDFITMDEPYRPRAQSEPGSVFDWGW